MPAASRIARAAPPAITPVPGAAGFSSTRAASCSPMIVVRDRRAGERDGEEVLPRLLHALLDRGRHFLRLAVAEADVAVAVADDDERGEREPPAALHDLGDAVDRDHSLFVLAFGHASLLLELQSGFAGAVGDRRDAAVVLEPAAVEHDGRRCRRPWPARRRACRPPWPRRPSPVAPRAPVGLHRRRASPACGRRRRRSPARRCACSTGTPPGAAVPAVPVTFLRTRRCRRLRCSRLLCASSSPLVTVYFADLPALRRTRSSA